MLSLFDGLKVLQSMDVSTYPIVWDISSPVNNEASLRKKRSKSKLLQMSVKFALIKEINRLTSSVMKKFKTTRVASGSSTTSEDRWTLLTAPSKVFNFQFIQSYNTKTSTSIILESSKLL